MSLTAEEIGQAAEVLSDGVVAAGAGHLALERAAGDQVPFSDYRYEIQYDNLGRISEARSWKRCALTNETIFTRFNADGDQLSRYVQCPNFGTTYMYDEQDRLVASSRTQNDGNNIDRYWYDTDGKLTSSAHIDVSANTHDIVLYQPNGTQFVQRTPYEGLDGWVSSASPIGQ
jgi:YD repeat-containing protein